MTFSAGHLTVGLPDRAAVTAPSREQLVAEARLVGLRGAQLPTLEDVERRRLQLWGVSITVLLTVCVALGLIAALPGEATGLASRTVLAAGMGVITAGFAVYAVEKELQLRRLTRLLLDERVLTSALTNRLHDLGSLLDAGRAINSVLELPAVLDIILGSATQLLQGEGGSIMLAQPDGTLRAVCVLGNEAARGAVVAMDEGIAGRVASKQEPVLITGDVTGGRQHPVASAMSVPLVHRQQLVGVLNVNAAPDRTFSEYDLRAFSLFAEQAASAIANAHLYEAERDHVAELQALERQKSAFLRGVSTDLRAPLTPLLGCARTLRRPDLTDLQRTELVGMVERQAERLQTMVEGILAAARLQDAPAPPRRPVDLAVLTRQLVAGWTVAGTPVEVIAPDSCVVTGDDESLRRVLDSLLENAATYGAPPVVVEVRPASAVPGVAELLVVDHGEGIAAEHRERIFDRFVRLRPHGGPSGMGLGLAVVRNLAAAMGGTAAVVDPAEAGHPRAGTAVRVRLGRWEVPPVHVQDAEGGTTRTT